MSPRKRIAILFHETTSDRRMRSYRIWHCAQVWERMGIEVKMLRGPDAPIEADVLIPHVDVSVLPDEYHRLLDSAPIVINRHVVDIRKSAFSKILASADDTYDGPVIVKTDRNCGGYPERSVVRKSAFRQRIRALGRRSGQVIRQCLASRSVNKLAYANTLNPWDYRIYPSKQEVPRCVFTNPDLIVERFLPETDGRFYYIRSYAFLGDEGLVVRMKEESPLVRSAATEPEFVEVDETIVAARRELGFDFGKFDYVVHDGRAVLLDINNTPIFGRVLSEEMRSRAVERLAKGIRQWLPEIDR